MKRNIVLVGFSGAGKSVFGRQLAAALGSEFVDLDSAIEAKYHLSVSDFFSKYGEKAFRVCENSVLCETLAKDNCVIAAGGGTPCFFDAMNLINDKALSVYLKLDVATIVKNLLASKKKRPLTDKYNEAQLADYVEKTLASRAPFYQKAAVTICSSDGKFSVEEVVGKLNYSCL